MRIDSHSSLVAELEVNLVGLPHPSSTPEEAGRSIKPPQAWSAYVLKRASRTSTQREAAHQDQA